MHQNTRKSQRIDEFHPKFRFNSFWNYCNHKKLNRFQLKRVRIVQFWNPGCLLHLCCRSPSVRLPVAVSRPFVFPALPSWPPSACLLLLLPLLFPSPLSCPCFALPCPCWSSWSFPCPLACLCRPCPGPPPVFTIPVSLVVLLLIAACNQKNVNK